ncbi:MAG: phosphotransferase family protein [Desulfobacterales bacterium]|jgi:aminoglycoside phosphotransferase (APT) family kinase protein|nr:phosphotransferase family protein [Desulfobacterales bacterium]
MQTIDKSRPPVEWIAHLEKRFPCEREINRVLRRKLLRRAGPPYTPVQLETLVKGIEGLLRSEIDGEFRLSEPSWLTGGASKLQMAFKLTWQQPGVGRVSTPMVLRMEPAESINETSRLREFQIIKAFEGHIPVPPVYGIDEEGKYLPYPAIIYGFIPGVTKPSGGAGTVSGVGTQFTPEIRSKLIPQFITYYTQIHRYDWRQADLGAFDVSAPGTQAAEWQLNWLERLWEEDSNEDVPLLRLAIAWMRKNMPPAETISVIHSDYRTGNYLYTEHDCQITAILDWELAHLGDRHEDIAYTFQKVFGNMDADGKTFLVCGLMTESEFYEAYEKASGVSVNRKAVDFYRIMGSCKAAVYTLGTNYRISRGGKTHQDILQAWLLGISYKILETLRLQLEEVI